MKKSIGILAIMLMATGAYFLNAKTSNESQATLSGVIASNIANSETAYYGCLATSNPFDRCNPPGTTVLGCRDASQFVNCYN
ncbi:hypothetical protein [Flagellimonas sp.]|uniref:hypothetical protein n=1 Tax=Flagellimonas sp. TaxID=2058762 RepID=UPI003B51613C